MKKLFTLIFIIMQFVLITPEIMAAAAAAAAGTIDTEPAIQSWELIDQEAERLINIRYTADPDIDQQLVTQAHQLLAQVSVKANQEGNAELALKADKAFDQILEESKAPMHKQFNVAQQQMVILHLQLQKIVPSMTRHIHIPAPARAAAGGTDVPFRAARATQQDILPGAVPENEE